MSKPLTVTGYLRMRDGSVKPMDELTAEERQEFIDAASEKIGRVFSEYYSRHPEEAALLKDIRDA